MTRTRMPKERVILIWGAAVLVVLGIGVGVPVSIATGQAPLIFAVEMLAVAALVVWYERAKRARERRDTAS